MRANLVILVTALLSTLGTHAGNLASSTPTPLTTTFTVGTGDWWQSKGLSLDINSGGVLKILNPTYETIVQQNAAGTSTIHINTGGKIDFSNASGKGTGFWLGNQSTGAYGIVELAGGTFDGSGLTDLKFGRNGAHGTFRISAGTATFGAKPTWGSGTGVIDFTASSTGILTIAGADQAYFEGRYNNGGITRERIQFNEDSL